MGHATKKERDIVGIANEEDEMDYELAMQRLQEIEHDPDQLLSANESMRVLEELTQNDS